MVLDRQVLANVTWYSEVITVVLTSVYSLVVCSDVATGGAHFTSSTWYSEGFCVFRGGGYTSHNLCFYADLTVGITAALLNFVLIFRAKDKALRTGCIVNFVSALFSVLHGLAHLALDAASGKAHNSMYPHTSTWPEFAQNYAFAFTFLGIGPFVGTLFGLPLSPCILVHAVSSYAYLFVPTQFGFGATQLFINMWYCLSRLTICGCQGEDAISSRVDHGWFASSVGNMLLMPIVFAEAFGCELFFMRIGGHVLYDGAILVIIAVNTVVLFRQCRHQKTA